MSQYIAFHIHANCLSGTQFVAVAVVVFLFLFFIKVYAILQGMYNNQLANLNMLQLYVYSYEKKVQWMI